MGALQHHVLDLGRLLGTAVAAAHAKRDGLQSGLRLSTPQIYAQLGQPSWLAVQPARAALDQVALVRDYIHHLHLDWALVVPQRCALDLWSSCHNGRSSVWARTLTL